MPNIGVPADLLIAGMSADAKNMLQRSMQRNGTERNAVAAERALVGCIIIVGEMMIDASCLYASLD